MRAATKGEKKGKRWKRELLPHRTITATPRLVTHTWFQGPINKAAQTSIPLIGVRKILNQRVRDFFLISFISQRDTRKTRFSRRFLHLNITFISQSIKIGSLNVPLDGFKCEWKIRIEG